MLFIRFTLTNNIIIIIIIEINEQIHQAKKSLIGGRRNQTKANKI